MNQGSSFFFTDPRSQAKQRDALRQQLMYGPQASNVGEGFNALAQGIRLRQMNNAMPQNQFPDAPGGGGANPLQGLMNFFGMKSGGLY